MTTRKSFIHITAAFAVAPLFADGADLAARHRYLNSIGISESAIVDLKYYDYARSKYLALGMKDTMP